MFYGDLNKIISDPGSSCTMSVQHTVGCSTPGDLLSTLGDIMTTVGRYQYTGGISWLMWGMIIWQTIEFVCKPRCTEHPPVYSWYPRVYSVISPCVQYAAQTSCNGDPSSIWFCGSLHKTLQSSICFLSAIGITQTYFKILNDWIILRSSLTAKAGSLFWSPNYLFVPRIKNHLSSLVFWTFLCVKTCCAVCHSYCFCHSATNMARKMSKKPR